MSLLVALAVAVLPPSVQPWPIGAGPRYQPPATTALVRGARPVGRFACGRATVRFRAHLELFANRQVIVVPAGVGVSRRCVYPVRTTAPSGVVDVAARAATVGDVFRVWGQQLGGRRLLSFSSSRVLAFVGGKRVSGDPRSIRLTPHAQIVLEIGGYVPPHPSYLFPRGAP